MHECIKGYDTDALSLWLRLDEISVVLYHLDPNQSGTGSLELYWAYMGSVPTCWKSKVPNWINFFGEPIWYRTGEPI